MPRLVETVHTVFSWNELYWLTITSYGQPASLLATNWSFLASVPLMFFVALLVHVISTLTQPLMLHHTDIVSIAILRLPGARALRRRCHTYNFGDSSDVALYRRDSRNCTALYTPPSPGNNFKMEMARCCPRYTLHVHRSLEHIILVLLPHTPTDRCQTVSSHLIDAVQPSCINVAM